MTRTILRVLITAGLVVVTATGCTSTRTGTATPGPSGRSILTGGATSAPAPRVSAPLAVSALTGKPCSLLTAAQLRTVGLTAATTTTQPDSDPVSVGCEWNDASLGTGTQLDVGLVTALHHGLSDIYAQRGTAAYWQPVTVAGYPGVLNDTVDERSAGTCRMDLGVTDTDVIDLAYQGSSTAQPCQKVQALAAAVVAALKGGS